MLRTSCREDDYHMLQQKIIHLNSELSRYKARVKEYQDDYHYSQLERLKEENISLKKQLSELEKHGQEEREAFAITLEKIEQGNKESLTYLEEFIEELEGKNRRSNELVIELEEKLLIAIEGEIRLQAEMANLEEKNKKEQEALISLRLELRKMKKDLEGSQNEAEILIAGRNALIEEKNHLKKQQLDTVNELLSMKSKLGSTGTKLVPNTIPASSITKENTNRITHLTSVVRELQKRVSESDSAISASMQQISMLEDQIDLLSALILKLDTRSEGITEDIKHH
jgi:chromosome segregation ATPase